MDIVIIDTNLDPIAILDSYESLLWTDRYRECGDFEIYTPITKDLIDIMKQDRYLQCQGSEHSMIIEKILIETDVENGDHVTITGRSLESILDRRIIWGQKTITGSLEEGVKTLLDECIINPSEKNRKISNFIFKYSNDPVIEALKIEAQFTGDNLYDIIVSICKEYGIGFKITLNDNKQFVFKLYAGKDRSYDQITNEPVIFSPEFDNILNTNYLESRSALKTITLIGGEGEGSERKYATVGEGKGLNRRELFTDARDINSNVGDGVILTDEEYTSLLEQRGYEKLMENVEVVSIEGEVEPGSMYEYGVDKDFYIGDIVQLVDEYGHDTKVRIIEMVQSENEDGMTKCPTFETIQEGA